MSSYDLCLAWNWEYDVDFVHLLDKACELQELSLIQITRDNVFHTTRAILNGEITFETFFDRASDSDAAFAPVVQWACHHAAHHINFHELACRAWDKVSMHKALSPSLYTPFSIILPSCDEKPMLPEIDLAPLGKSFTIKPAFGGGGDGVVTKATLLSQVALARQSYPSQKYLLQAHIASARLGSRMAWFRIIYCAGKVYLCWWSDTTHAYTPVTPHEESFYDLGHLRSIASSVARICGLDLFSTEISLTPDGRFVVVDYVNDPIDLRLQSKAFDGVPDDMVQDIAGQLVQLAASRSFLSRNASEVLSLGYQNAYLAGH